MRHRLLLPIIGLVLGFAGTVVQADTVVLGAAKDNTLYEHPMGLLSNGAGQHFFGGKTAVGAIRRGLVAFDVAASIPAGSTIQSVMLTLNMSRTSPFGGPASVDLHRVLEDWGEGTSDAPFQEGGGAPSTPGDATWIHTFFPDTFWGTVGGKFDLAASASITVNAIGFYTWGSTTEMVADVQQWLDDPSTDFGWILVGDESRLTTAKRFDTHENPTPAVRPVLRIDFTPPMDIVVLPNSFTIIRGLLISGGLPDLFDSDDSRLVVRTAVFAPSIDPPVQIEVVGTSPTESPSELRFRFEGMASRNLIERRISLYNYVTQSYEELHVAFAATSDEVVEIVVTTNASRFVEPGTGQVKSLMTWKAAAFSFFTGWNVGTDQTIWTVTP
ncbi:MAG: DNRLRE domain-containing protein [Armatimonadetes bacterium]|nr:DNRLRE domain-containing protein [Armatimonadota bacterium]